jgi:quinol monooxygenase YgiN
MSVNFNRSVMRVFEVRAKAGYADALEKKLASTSISVVQGQPGNLGYFFGKKAGSADEFVFVSLWDSLASVKTQFGDDWEQSYLPPGYAEIIDECSIKHFEFDGAVASTD